MTETVEATIANLKRKTVRQLRDEYLQLFDEYSHSCNRTFLIKRIAWRLQEFEYGGIPDEAKERLYRLAHLADIRVQAPKNFFPKDFATRIKDTSIDRRLPQAGTILTRKYKGKEVNVKVLERGFEADGEYFKTLSAAVTTLTGTKWNGFKFFGLGKK